MVGQTVVGAGCMSAVCSFKSGGMTRGLMGDLVGYGIGGIGSVPPMY